ncbi:hypothetical protein [Achromobacter sp. GbtcB20]|uniref:hypothetical protein n=1 Tax=Achromobacter sp. GbtcB20 TaxID=2824765 RepID=UPI00187B269E|nr:hypothetical protein [Achromobacter sp. GbtcB20]
MTSTSRYSYQSYMERLRTLLLASGPGAAVVVLDGVAATLSTPGRVFGFAHEDLNQVEFEFDQSAWSGSSWDGETHAQTWSIFVAPTIFTR